MRLLLLSFKNISLPMNLHLAWARDQHSEAYLCNFCNLDAKWSLSCHPMFWCLCPYWVTSWSSEGKRETDRASKIFDSAITYIPYSLYGCIYILIPIYCFVVSAVKRCGWKEDTWRICCWQQVKFSCFTCFKCSESGFRWQPSELRGSFSWIQAQWPLE